MNKKGNIDSIILIVGILFLILILGLGLVFGSIVIDWVFDTAMPEITTIGMVGNTNISSASETALNPVNTIVQSFQFMAGVIYLLLLIGCVGLSFAFRFTGNKWLAGLFIVMILMLIMASIFISNIYEDFYNDTGDVGSRLREHAFLSWMILYSPMIMSIVGMVCGIIMFTGEGGEMEI